MEGIYKTLKSAASAELVEKKSRFIAHAAPVSSESEAVNFVDEKRREYRNATHNVYAYIIKENNITRCSDDGEPAGTAGVPILEVLKREELTNLVVVVTRYFGGTLLGTGGLVHTYSRSAKLGISAAGILEMIPCRELTVECEYTYLAKIQNELRSADVIAGETVYSDTVTLPLFVPVDKYDALTAALVDVSRANVTLRGGRTLYKGREIFQS